MTASAQAPVDVVRHTTTGKESGSFEIVGDTGDLFYDATRKRQRRRRLPGARTSLFVPELARLYLAVPHRGSTEAEIRIYEMR